MTRLRRSIGELRACIAFVFMATLCVSAVSTADAGATTVVQCNQYLGTTNNYIWCPFAPNIPLTPRHTYYGGWAAMGSGTQASYFWVEWRVAYENSNASTYKYGGSGYYGLPFYNYFPANTQLLRGYFEGIAGVGGYMSNAYLESWF